MKAIMTTMLTATAVITLGACSSTPEPTDRLASAQASVRAARELRAAEVPRAELHVRLAEEQVQSARKLMEEGENHRADMLLRRAKADADLALALTRHQAAMGSAKAQSREAAEDRKELDRANDVSGSPESSLPPRQDSDPTSSSSTGAQPMGQLAPLPNTTPDITRDPRN